MSTVDTIGKDFTTKELIKFAAAPVFTRFATALLMTFDDGLFISRFIGPNGLAAFSIGMPVFMVTGAASDLFCGVAVLCATKMGEGKKEEAKGDFTAVAIIMALFGCLVTAGLWAFIDPVIRFLGGTDILFPYIKDFFSISVMYIPLTLLANLFTRFFVPAGKPEYNMVTTMMSTVLNVVFDYVFIVAMNLGMKGAAYANLVANLAVVVFGLVFFSGKTCEIGFAKPSRKIWPLIKRCFKLGLPNFLTSIALSVNSYVANQILLGYGGEESVSAYTIVNNIQFMFMNGLFGLSGTVCPIVSYAYGEKNNEKIKKTIKQIFTITTGLTALIILAYILTKGALLSLYIKQGTASSIRQMADYGLTVAPLAYLFFDYNVMAIDVFTALNDSVTSTKLTVLENTVFANAAIIGLPMLFGLKGVWFAFMAGEAVTMLFTGYYSLREIKRLDNKIAA